MLIKCLSHINVAPILSGNFRYNLSVDVAVSMQVYNIMEQM